METEKSEYTTTIIRYAKHRDFLARHSFRISAPKTLTDKIEKLGLIPRDVIVALARKAFITRTHLKDIANGTHKTPYTHHNIGRELEQEIAREIYVEYIG